MKRIYWLILPPIITCIAVFVRWVLQGSRNLYSDFSKEFYIPDPDLGWRLTESSVIWLGLDLLCIAIASLVVVAIAIALISRQEDRKKKSCPTLRAITAIVGGLTLVIPILAFATGFGPEHGRDQLSVLEDPVGPDQGLLGSLPGLTKGRYEVMSHSGTQITASVHAGQELFEARVSGEASGYLDFDPSDLSHPVAAEVSVASRSVDTGIALRSKHAREALKSEQFPRIRFALARVDHSAQVAPNRVAFAAEGTVELVGMTHSVDVTGTLTALAPEGRHRLGFPDDLVLIAKAHLVILIADSAIANDGTFDADEVPIQVSLVLVRKNDEATQGEPSE